jgi:hypothetical protein
VTKYRLRFLLQEVELAGPEVILGRGEACHVTLDDPMVSRRHARIQLSGPRPIIADLGSRNGVRVNGELIAGATPLQHDDRVRLGTQDLVLVEVGQARSEVYRTTNGVPLCSACKSPSQGSGACSHCGASLPSSFANSLADLPTAAFSGPGSGWMFDLLDDVFERMLTAGRLVEAHRMLRAVADEIEARWSNEQRIEASARCKVSSHALRLAEAQGSHDWMHWVLQLHESHAAMLSAELVERFESSAPSLRRAVHSEVSTYLERWRARSAAGATDSERAQAERLAAALRN